MREKNPTLLFHVKHRGKEMCIRDSYYGAKDAGFGACGSILNLFEEDFRHHPKIVGHILEEECAQLLQDFFAQVRKKSPENLKIL